MNNTMRILLLAVPYSSLINNDTPYLHDNKHPF